MKKVNLLKYGLTALMMAFAMTLCYSCSNDDDDPTVEEPTPPTNGESKISGTINGHAYVELAGYKWATENVGQLNRGWDWVEAIAGPGAKNNEWGCYYYTQSNAKLAAMSWGSTWKLPTEIQWRALINKCKWEWTKDYNGKEGYIVYEKDKGKGKYNSVFGYSPSTDLHIFLPVAGFCYDNGLSNVNFQGGVGYYWSNSAGRYLYFYDVYCNMSDYDSDLGLAVRLVSE